MRLKIYDIYQFSFRKIGNKLFEDNKIGSRFENKTSFLVKYFK